MSEADKMAERLEEEIEDASEPILLARKTVSEAAAIIRRLSTENAAQAERIAKLEEAAEKVIEMNLQHAQDEFGDRRKAETWACVLVLRAALGGDNG
jgi:hypothetical protein